MTRLWRREGLLLQTRPDHPLLTRAYVPTVLPLGDTLWRVYFAGWDQDKRSRILAVDVDPTRSMQVVGEHFSPLFDLGQIGTFDHSGTIPCCAIAVGSEVWLYYFGLYLRKDVPAAAAIGLAVSDDGLHFRRPYLGPVLGTGPLDPFFSSTPCVRRYGDGYRMWYVSGLPWTLSGPDGRPDPAHGIRLAHSRDGRLWAPDTVRVMEPREPAETGLARPWIVPSGAGGQFYYSRRGGGYREGGQTPYHIARVAMDAESGQVTGSPVALEYENPPQPGDFDSWMQAYSCVLPCGDDLIMVYNGNDFGKTGIGWARLPGGATQWRPR